jgi:hypothetical protein
MWKSSTAMLINPPVVFTLMRQRWNGTTFSVLLATRENIKYIPTPGSSYLYPCGNNLSGNSSASERLWSMRVRNRIRVWRLMRREILRRILLWFKTLIPLGVHFFSLSRVTGNRVQYSSTVLFSSLIWNGGLFLCLYYRFFFQSGRPVWRQRGFSRHTPG